MSERTLEIQSVPDESGELRPVTIDNLVSVLPGKSLEVHSDGEQWKAREGRTPEDALAHAEKLRLEIPQLVQPEASAYDLVTLADEVIQLRAKQA